MRIVAGKFRGRNLAKSDHLDLRPTTDKNREALFSILSSAKFIREIGFEMLDAQILDLCCGTGAVGFEALSRGAKSVVFIDKNLSHLEIVKKNAVSFAVENQSKILCFDAKKLPKNDVAFDLIFIDPPYVEDYQSIIASLFENGWIGFETLVVIEFAKTDAAQNFPDLKLLETRNYGKTTFVFLVKTPGSGSAGA